MEAVSQNNKEAAPKGLCLAVIPSDKAGQGGVYPHRYSDLDFNTGLPSRAGPLGALTRNHVNIALSDVVIALPGGAGTVHEITLALASGKPLRGFGRVDQFKAALPAGFELTGELLALLSWLDQEIARLGASR